MSNFNRIVIPATLATLAFAMLGGCTSKNSNQALEGTWQGRADTEERPFTFGSVTFAGDGTYTAEAKYGDKIRVQTGRYTTTEEGLILDGTRIYDLGFEEEAVIFTDPGIGNSMTLDRYR